MTPIPGAAAPRFVTYACHTALGLFQDSREVIVTFQLATAVAVMGLFTIVAVYFLWVRKLDKKEEN
jgi:hypothetical protein